MRSFKHLAINHIQTYAKSIALGALLSVGVIAILNASNARGADTVIPPTAPTCGVANSWTVVSLNRGITSLGDLTDNNNRINNSLIASGAGLGTSVNITSTLPVMSGNGVLNLSNFVSWDGYVERPSSPASGQGNEQWLVEVTDGNGTTTRTNFTPDLTDGVMSTQRTGNFSKTVAITNGVSKVSIRHYNDFNAAAPEVYNSVVPAGFCYKFTPEVPEVTCDSITVETLSFRKYRFTVNVSKSGGVKDSDLRYRFNFGDNSFFDTFGNTIEHSYSTAGKYKVIATVISDKYGLKSECEKFVDVPEDPSLTCDSLTMQMLSSKTYKFTATPKLAGGVKDSDVEYSFDFGDGTSLASASNMAQHSYVTAGKYTITVTLKADKFGLQASCEKTLDVPEDPYLVCEKLDVLRLNSKNYKFTATADFGGGVKASDISYSFDFGDGTKIEGSEQMVEHEFASAGTYTVTVAVSADAYGLQETCEKVVEVPEDPALTCESLTVSHIGGLTYRFTSMIKLLGGVTEDDVEYHYSFGDGTELNTDLSEVDHTYTSSGDYTIVLTIMAPQYELETTCETQVSIPQTPSLTCGSFTAEKTTGRTFKFVVTPTITGDIDPSTLSYIYDFGDGQKVTSSQPKIEHTYTTPGRYIARVTVVSEGQQIRELCEVAVDVPHDPEVLGKKTLPKTGSSAFTTMITGVSLVSAVAFMSFKNSKQTAAESDQEYFNRISL